MMKTLFFKNGLLIFFILLILLFSVGCAYNDIFVSNDNYKEEKLRQRVAERWEAMINKDMLKVYEFYDPFFRANITSSNMPGLSNPAQYYSYEIKGIDIKGNVAFVDVEIEYSYSFIGKLGKRIERSKTSQKLTNTWLYMDGTWWLQYIDAISEGTFAQY